MAVGRGPPPPPSVFTVFWAHRHTVAHIPVYLIKRACVFCDAASVAVSPSEVVAVGNNALSAVGFMPPCGVRARVYPDPAVLGTGLGENIVSIS